MIENFIITFTEVISIMILWSKFALERRSLPKNLLIIVIAALVNTTTQFNLYANTILSYMALILSVCYIYHKNIARTMLEFLFVMLMIIALQISVISLFGIFIPIDMDNFNISLSINTLIIFLSFVIYRYVPVFNKSLVIKIDKKIITYFIINLFGYILLTKVLWDYDNDIILKNWISFVLIISVMFLINTVMYFYIVKIEQERRNVAVKAKYSEVLRGITDEIRGRQHDFKNHLNVISGLVEINDKNEDSYKVKNYIDCLSNSMQGLENIMYIDNPILSAILYSKVHEANKINIKLTYDIKNPLMETYVKDYELVEILTNLIDNGFEALEKYEGEKCLIVRTYFEDKMNILEVSNMGISINSEDINRIFQKGFTTKGEAGRGFGLYNVKKIVERSGGMIQLSFEENTTVFKLFI